MVGSRVALQRDILVMVLHANKPGFPPILPEAANYTAFDLTHRSCCLYLNDNVIVISVHADLHCEYIQSLF